MSAAVEPVSEDTVVRVLAANRVLPVLTLHDADDAVPVVRALMGGGLTCAEIALRTPAGIEAIRRASELDGLLVGAGTVLTVEQLHAAADAGAAFAVAPATNEDVIAAARELALPFFAGVATANEIERARGLGLRTLKVFPATQAGGPGFLRAMAAVYPDVGFIPTGGIGPATLAEYLALECVVACGGTWLAPAELIPGRLDEVERRAREALVGA
jgi:2-dehydro-3-deoxyphosphogluconate aldolase / (4S)-4-hydroxy-2-oxoglutarate aldolase